MDIIVYRRRKLNKLDYWLNQIIKFLLFILAFSSKLGYEEHIPGQTRDWNEELQTTRELPRKNLPERLLRERAIFKVHYVSLIHYIQDSIIKLKIK